MKRYRRGAAPVLALDGVDFRVAAGDYVAIVGASGSGKSTLLNIIGTLDLLDEGTYELDGVITSGLSDAALSRLRSEKIGFVFQSFHLLPRYTALANVELPMSYAGVPRKERRARAMEALTSMGLADRAGHLPSELSGGQQQRVALARALVNRPRLLLADEPTGALDSQTTESILDLFDTLNSQGVTLLMVTHSSEVAGRAHRMVRMKDGRIVEGDREMQRLCEAG